MDMAVTVAYVPGGIDLDAGLRRLADLGDAALAARAPDGILGWGWSIPGDEAPPRPWAGDAALEALERGGEVPADLVAAFATAARTSLARCRGHAARLLGGEVPGFESRVATRIPVASGGELFVCAEDAARGGEDCELCDPVRLAVELLPELGAAMGAHGLGGLDVAVTVRAG